jgi:UTP:GlnB (protein PII) uridylyltransferase
MVEERIDLIGAKIMTVGERAEDVFHLRGADGLPLAEDAAQRLITRLTDALDRRQAA